MCTSPCPRKHGGSGALEGAGQPSLCSPVSGPTKMSGSLCFLLHLPRFLSFFIPMRPLSNSSFRKSVDDGDSPISKLLALQAPDEAIRSKVCLGGASSALLGDGAPLLDHLERDKPGCLVAVSVCDQHLAGGSGGQNTEVKRHKGKVRGCGH